VEPPANGDHELVITRRLFRSGDSEYLLDGNRVRLRDIKERLMGTGLGARACFTIGQGKIDQVLSASSVDRREPIEEAAGITLYRRRRHLTELKLEATAQDLARLDDITEEVGKHVRSLKRQAGRARRYKKLRDRLREIERTWLSAAYTESREKLELARGAVAGIEAAERAVRVKLESTGALLATARRELQESRAEEQSRQQGLYQSQLEHERLKAEARRQLDRATFAEERQEELRRRLVEMRERLEEAESLHERRLAAAQDVETAAEIAAQILAEAEERLQKTRRRLEEAVRAMEKPEIRDLDPAELEGRPLLAHLLVDEHDFPALRLTLGELLDAPILNADDIDTWRNEILDGASSERALWPAGTAMPVPPPADDRIEGSLGERVEGRSEAARAVLAVLLQNTWVVKGAANVAELATEHPGHSFVDVTGSCWASGVEVRAQGRQLALTAFRRAEAAGVVQDPATARQESQVEAVTSPEELADREARDRAQAAHRAADSQADAARQEVAVSGAACKRLQHEIERTTSEVGALKEAVGEAKARAEKATQEAEAAALRSKDLEAELEASVSDDKSAEATVAGLEAAMTESRNELERVQAVRSEGDVEAAEARMACQHVEEQIRERLNIEPHEVHRVAGLDSAAGASDDETSGGTEGDRGRGEPAAGEACAAEEQATETEPAPVLDVEALRAEVHEVQAAIERLGPVNLVAYDEFLEEEARFKELDTSRKDLIEATKNLREAIKTIDEDCIERFSDAFDAINGYFHRIFRQLFGGGKASMALDDPDDPLNSGIEISAQPPGKKLQNIRLLSGGERSLVALSLLFAIFEYRPAAFCILDEADAALDEPNVERFLRALTAFQDRTQFILITHNKRSMEMADLLYGVTMQESGVSTLVSVQLN
jgi:chromosome segregation protein